MEDLSFSALAPRFGTRPVMGTWSEIGTSQMNGGALSWSGLWSGLKSFGSSLASTANKAWNSGAVQSVRNKLKDADVQGKIGEVLASGVHGALDVANQAVSHAVDRKLQQQQLRQQQLLRQQREQMGVMEPSYEMETDELPPPPKELLLPPPPPPSAPPAAATPARRPAKRPAASTGTQEILIRSDEPPPYEELYPDKAGIPATLELRPPPETKLPAVAHNKMRPPPPLTAPTTPAPAPAAPVRRRPAAAAPASSKAPQMGVRARGWQTKLNTIVGLGVRTCKRRRCY